MQTKESLKSSDSSTELVETLNLHEPLLEKVDGNEDTLDKDKFLSWIHDTNAKYFFN